MYLKVIFGLEAKKVFLKEHGAPEGTQQTQISLFLQGGRGVLLEKCFKLLNTFTTISLAVNVSSSQYKGLAGK